MLTRRTNLRLLAAATLGVGIAVPVVAIASGGSGHYTRTAPVGSPLQVGPARGRIPPFGPNIQAGLDALAHGLPLVRNPRLGRIDVDDVHGLLLEFDLEVPALSGGRTAEALWEGEVFAGAAAARLASGGTALAEVQETLVTPDGTRRPIGGGLGHVVTDQVFVKAPADIDLTVATRASGLGLQGARTEVLHALQDAILIHLRTSDVGQTASALRAKPGFLTEILGSSPTDYEGVFLEIDDAAGAPLYVNALTGSNGSTMVWARPDLRIPIIGAGTGTGG